MNNNFSRQLKEAISFSMEESIRLGTNYIGTGHLLLGLIKENRNNAIEIFKSHLAELPELKKEIEKVIEIENDRRMDTEGKARVSKFSFKLNKGVALNKSAEKAIHESVSEAKKYESPRVEVEHLLLAILKNVENIETKILNRIGIDYDIATLQILQIGTN